MTKVKKLKQEPKKILIYGDFPLVPTGFATVTRNLAKQLHKRGYVVDMVAINYNEADHCNVPYLRYFRAAHSNRDQDTFGRQTLLNAINGMKGTYNSFSDDYDYVFMLQDPFILDGLGEKLKNMQIQRAQQGRKIFKTIWYVPIDGEQYDKWLVNMLNFDVVIPFSNFGQREIERCADEAVEYYRNYIEAVNEKYVEHKQFNPQQYEQLIHNALQRIAGLNKVLEKKSLFAPVYHGTDTSTFRPLEQAKVDDFRAKYFMENNERFIVGCVNRNQPRKDIPRTVEIFDTLRKDRPEAFLYLHMDAADQMGMDIRALCNGFGMIEGVHYATMTTYGLDWTKVSPEMMNLIYNSLDCCLTSTLGEGWGLTITEAMAAYCPVVAPANTTIPEILGDGRGYIYDLESTYATHTQGDFVRKRNRGSIESAVAAIKHVMDNPESVDRRCDRALKWVNEHTWDKEIFNMIKRIEG